MVALSRPSRAESKGTWEQITCCMCEDWDQQNACSQSIMRVKGTAKQDGVSTFGCCIFRRPLDVGVTVCENFDGSLYQRLKE